MVNVPSAFVGAALFLANAVLPVAADSYGSYVWDPPVTNEINVYSRLIELQHAGDSNGKLLATWEHWYVVNETDTDPNGEQGSFIIRESNDNGATWSTLSTVKDTQDGPGHPFSRFWQPFFFEFPHKIGHYPEGTLLLVGNLVPENDTITEFFSWRSSDHGKTWDPMNVWQRGGPSLSGIWEPFLYLDNKGRLIAAFSDERDGDNHSQMLVHVVSEDGGDTWGEVVRDVASSNQTDRPGMVTVSLMDIGEYFMSYEVCGRPGCPVYTKTSKDGVTWNADDVGGPVVTNDGVHPAGSPYTIWDSTTKQLVMGGKSVKDPDDNYAPQHDHAVFINTDHGKGEWYWAPSPWAVSNSSTACNANYSPNLLALGDGVVRYTAPTSQGDSGYCSENTGAAPVGVLPYKADFSTNDEAGWVNFAGKWTVSEGAYVAEVDDNGEARAFTGSSGWPGYEISADVMISGDSGSAGLTARVTAPNSGLSAFDGYTASIDAPSGKLTISRQNQDSTDLKLISVKGGIKPNMWYKLSFSVNGSDLIAILTTGRHAMTTVSVSDDTYAVGMAGLSASGSGAKFKNVEIK